LNKTNHFWFSIRFVLPAVLLLTIGLFFFLQYPKDSPTPTKDYWIWRATDLEHIELDSNLIIYQGDYLLDRYHPPFIKRGLSPGKIDGQNEITLLIRLYQLKSPDTLAKYISLFISQWNAFQIQINQIQLDYDSPSSQLENYAKYIAQLNTALKTNKVHADISITGLLTWLTDSPKELQYLSKEVAYIDYQLYNHFYPLDNIKRYYPFIQAIKHPYKIGVTTANEFSQLSYPKNKYYLGESVFLNISNNKP